MKPPSHMSLPRASEMTIDALDFSRAAVARMRANGIVSALQLAELASRAPRLLKAATGVTATKVIRHLTERLGEVPDFTRVATAHQTIPVDGVLLNPPQRRRRSRAGAAALVPSAKDALPARLGDVPDKVLLVDRMQPVGDQGQHGTCVGWAANAVHEYRLNKPMSAGYAYRGAKSRDGLMNVSGSWLSCALEHGYDTGHVNQKAYSYADAILERPIEPLAPIAAAGRSIGHVQLLRRDMRQMPTLLRAALAGRLHPELGPLPVAISIRLHESFVTTSTALDGLIRLPLPGERLRSGHAMCIVGHVMARHRSNPFGIDYFVVRNSWGTDWACHNPFGHPGHALIPAPFFANGRNLMEAYICMGGAAKWRA